MIYETIAISVYFSLFFAYPKSRAMLNEEMQKKLLSIFSVLFTGMEIKSTKLEKWDIDTGAGNML